MAVVNTNNVSLAYLEENKFGVAPATGEALYIEPNEISDFGAEITTVARNPISRDRQNKKGTITDFSSTVSFAGDTTVSFIMDFLEGAMYSTWYKRGLLIHDDFEVTTSGYHIKKANKQFTTPLKAGVLIYVRGFLNGANNGLKKVATGSTVSDIKVEGGGLIAETASLASSLAVVGFEFDSGKLSIDSTGNLVSTQTATEVFVPSQAINIDYDDEEDITEKQLESERTERAVTNIWEALCLQVGQAIYIGDLTSSNSFAKANNYGLARIREIKGNELIIDKRRLPYTSDDGSGKKIHLFFGWFLRNVPTDHSYFKERTYTFELAYPHLHDVRDTGNQRSQMDPDYTPGEIIDTIPGYEYAIGNLVNTFELSMPLNDKSTTTITTFGKDIDPITSTRKRWTFRNPVFTEAFSTPNDFLRLRLQRIDEEGLTTYFKDATLTINNNVQGENVLGKLGPAFVSYGNFDVSLETSALFTNEKITSMIRNNCTVTCDFCLFNNDGAFYFDIPSMTLGDGSRDFTVNEKVKINLSGSAFGDTALGYALSCTFFPYLPSEKADACD